MKIVNHHAGCCGYHPVRPDGQQWAHVLGLAGGSSVHADSPGEILGELIPGYGDLPDEASRRRARERHALEVGVAHQQVRIDEAVAAGLVDPGDPADADLMALLREVACRPIGLARTESAGSVPADSEPAGEASPTGGSAPADPEPAGDAGPADAANPGDAGPRRPVWEGAIRLVCLTTAYAPYGELPPPAGAVDWLDPTDEEAYLVSLRRAGALDYWSEAVYDSVEPSAAVASGTSRS